MSKKDLESLYDEALTNVRDDRKLAREFLNEVANQIAQDATQNKYLSPVAAKHVESLQRSNEQLVKIINIMNKKESSQDLTMGEMENIYDMIKEDKE